MLKSFGWATVLVMFFAAPAFAQGGFLCGPQGAGGVGDNGCDGVTLPATQLLANAPATTTIDIEIFVDVWVDTVTGVETAGPAAINLVALPGNNDVRLGDQGAIAQAADQEQAAAEEEAEAFALAADRRRMLALVDAEDKACAGVPASLKVLLCPPLR